MSLLVPYNLGQTAASDELSHLEGLPGEFKDFNISDSGVKSYRTGLTIYCLWVKNEAGVALLPGEIPIWLSSAVGTSVGAKAGSLIRGAGVVDPYLPAAGVADNDHFWLVYRGPTEIIQKGAAGWDAGDILVTAAAGRVDEFDGTATADGEADAVFGKAIAACLITAGLKCRALVNFTF